LGEEERADLLYSLEFPRDWILGEEEPGFTSPIFDLRRRASGTIGAKLEERPGFTSPIFEVLRKWGRQEGVVFFAAMKDALLLRLEGFD
jgi:hypothetical protein